jgi:hypothetical protein
MLDVLDGEMLEQIGNRAIALLQGVTDGAVIFVRTADRLFEDRRVRRDALDAVGIDQLFQVAPGDEAAGQEIQPDRLAMVFECFDGIHDALFLFELAHSRRPVTFRREGEFCQPVPVGMLTGGICVSGGTTPFTTYRSPGGCLAAMSARFCDGRHGGGLRAGRVFKLDDQMLPTG